MMNKVDHLKSINIYIYVNIGSAPKEIIPNLPNSTYKFDYIKKYVMNDVPRVN